MYHMRRNGNAADGFSHNGMYASASLLFASDVMVLILLRTANLKVRKLLPKRMFTQ
jgi:hypothetical protein